jgi:AraC-like DNA-binding protein
VVNPCPNYFWFTPDRQVGFQHFRYDRKFIYPARVQDEYVIVFCLAGEVFVSEGERVEKLLPGEILIGNSQQWRSSRYGGEGNCEGLTLVVSRRSVQAALRDLGDPRFESSIIPVFLGKREFRVFFRVAEDAIAELRGSEVGRSHVLEALGRQMLVRSLRSWRSVDVQRPGISDRVLARRHYVSALDYMQSRGKNEFSMQGMCDQVGLSVGEFTRLFRRCTASTPLATYNRLLMHRALVALQSGAGSIKEVAHSLGFDSASHFTVLFRKTTGHAPSQIRSLGSVEI